MPGPTSQTASRSRNITQSIDEALKKCILLRHPVQPVAIPTIVQVWMNEPLTEIPPAATRSAS